MNKISFGETIDTFQEKIKEQYPDITREQLKEICSGPFQMLKNEMTKGSFKAIRFQFFGMFVVYPKNINDILQRMTKNFEKGLIPEDNFNKQKKILTDYLKSKNYGNLENKD